MPFNSKRVQSKSKTSITKVMSILGALAACVISIAIPCVYYVISINGAQDALTIESAFVAKSIERIVQSRPDLWEYEIIRLKELISQPSLLGNANELELRNAAGKLITKTDFTLSRPTISVSTNFFDSGLLAGSIVVRHSIRKQIITTTLIGILSSLLGCLIYYIFRTYPIRKLENTLIDLQRERDKSEKTLYAVGDGVISVDPGGKILLINRIAESLVGMDISEAVGRQLEEVYVLRQDQENRVGEKECILTGKGGNECAIEEVRTTLTGMDSDESGVVIVFRDITERKRIKEALQRAHDELEQRVADRTEELMRVNEELRTEITARKRTEEALKESEELFRSYLEYAPDGVYMSDLEGKFLYGNRKCEEIIGYRREELIGKNFLELNILPEQSLNKAAQLLQANIEDKSTGPDEIELFSKEGRLIPVEISTSVVQRMGQRIVLAFVRDITKRKRAEEELRMSEERFRRIFDEGPFGMILTNPDYTIVMANKVFCGLLGYSEQELTGRSVEDITCEEDREKSREFSGQLFEGSIPVYRFEKRYIKKDGGILWANITASGIHGIEGKVLYGLAIIEDLTDRRKAADKIHLLAYYDSLTGLPNRTFHKELMGRSIEHARRRKEIFALIHIGLDNFQRINDTLGHSIGDILLKVVADRLTNSMRKSDYIARSDEGGTADIVSRVGGDEFIVLAHDLNQSQDAVIAASRLLKEISAPYDLSGREVFMTASIGITLYPDDGTVVDDLLKNAETAMRHTKIEGKNSYQFYSGSMNSFVLELLTLESELHKALERDELVLYYQPKVNAVTRMVNGMEALIRWKHPDKGLIPPMQFIPLAETSGLIIPIGEFVIRTVCGQIKTWQEAGYKQTNIALNVSGRQFDQQNLIEIFKDALQNTMISPEYLVLEITESTIMRNPEKAIRTLTELKALGIKIAIDDFGTGYSSLSYLKRLLPDYLKIDQSFVKNLASDPSDQAIVRATISMAHSLNLKTVAEGVETEEQLSFLQEHGCDEIQGYLFSRPLPAEEIPGILAKEYL